MLQVRTFILAANRHCLMCMTSLMFTSAIERTYVCFHSDTSENVAHFERLGMWTLANRSTCRKLITWVLKEVLQYYNTIGIPFYTPIHQQILQSADVSIKWGIAGVIIWKRNVQSQCLSTFCASLSVIDVIHFHGNNKKHVKSVIIRKENPALTVINWLEQIKIQPTKPAVGSAVACALCLKDCWISVIF